MGITKLMHIKQRKKGKMSVGLYNAIYYITNPKKTQNKRLIGGNCGRDEEMIYNKFMDTKKIHDKYDGRQGYHFVISFSPLESVSADLCMNIMADFMEEYLKNEYDAVYAVHDDQEHMHGHLIFNSVNSVTGKKYRYEDGDWEKYIQPITDKIAEKYGLSKLEFVSAAEEEKNIDWNKKIREDIKLCISMSEDYDDFKNKMQTIYDYGIREGFSKKYGTYITYKPPGKSKAVRSYRLPRECQPYDISRRISLMHQPEIHVPIIKEYYFSNAFYKNRVSTFVRWDKMSIYQKDSLMKIYKAAKLYNRKLPSSWESERILNSINRSMLQYSFLMKHGIRTAEDMDAVMDDLNMALKNVNSSIRKCRKEYADFLNKGDDGSFSLFEIYEEAVTLKALKEKISESEQQRLDEIERMLEENYVGEVYMDYHTRMNDMLREKHRIKKELRLARSSGKELDERRQKQQEASREQQTDREEKNKKM